MAPINTAVIGYGSSAKIFHIPFILSLPEQYKLHSVLQRHPTPENDATKDHPDVKLYKKLPDLLSDNEIELVVVTSIPDTHYEITKDCLQAGKHVVCEKPFVATEREARELERIAKESGKLLCIYQNRRWDADFLRARKLIEDGRLGRVVEFESHFDRYRPTATQSWKTKPSPTSGAIFDLGTHLLDQITTLFGLPASVTAFLTNQRTDPSPGGDSFTIHLHYPSSASSSTAAPTQNLLATAKASVISPETSQLRFWIRGTKGTLKSFGMDPQEDQLKQGRVPTTYTAVENSVRKEPLHDFGVDTDPGTLTSFVTNGEGKEDLVERRLSVDEQPRTYKEFYVLLADAVRNGEEGPVTGRQAADLMMVVEACIKSSEEGISVAL